MADETAVVTPAEQQPAEPVQPEPMSLRDMPVASVEDILAGSELVSNIEVLVPRWGKVIIREISAAEQFQAREDATIKGEIDSMLLTKKILKAALVKPLLTDGQIEKILAGSSEPLNAVYKAINKLNLFGQDGEAKADAAFQK